MHSAVGCGPMSAGRRSVPRATYRVQLHAGFTFDDARAIVPYLRDLGISHLFCSPVLQAAAGSTHGYDVVDHGRVSAELGGEEAWLRLTDAVRDHDMGTVLDIVPNHMAIGEGNRWWWDVLTHGRASEFASFFDIEWDPPESRLRDVILLPVLADHYGRVLEAGGDPAGRPGRPADRAGRGSDVPARSSLAGCRGRCIARGIGRGAQCRRRRARCPPEPPALPVGALAVGVTGPWVSALLRHRRPGRVARRGRAGVRRDARAAAALGGRGTRRRPAHRSSRWAA